MGARKSVRFSITGILFLLLSSPLWIREVQRPPTPEQLPGSTQASLLQLARQALGVGLGTRSDAGLLQAVKAQGSPAEGPILVTVYREGGFGGLDAPMGLSATDGDTTIGEAVAAAAKAAGATLKRRGIPELEESSLRIKLDIGATPRRLLLPFPWYVEWVVDPGRDGLAGRLGSRFSAIPPSYPIEKDWRIPRQLNYVTRPLEREGGRATLSLYRTAAFVEGVAGEEGPLSIMRANVPMPPLTSERLETSLQRAGDYLSRMVNEDGRYCYNYLPENDECDKDYNLLRHAGTTYSLFQIYRTFGGESVLSAAERATGWLKTQIYPVEGDNSRAYLLEGDKAKLGAAGLTLLCLVEREKALKDGRDRMLLTQLGNFIIGQQRSDGYLESWFEWKKGVTLPETNSIYYPGEALLGLIRLHDIDHDQKWLEAAILSAEFLAFKRWKWGGIELYVPPDAWLTQALAELYSRHRDDRIKDYTYELVEVTEVSSLRPSDGATPDLVGGPAFGLMMPGVTPAGSRSEGLSAAWRMALEAGDTTQAAEIRTLSLEMAHFQVMHQFRPANSYMVKNPARALGGFRDRPDKLDVRIDTVQHNISGLLGVLEMLNQMSTEGR